MQLSTLLSILIGFLGINLMILIHELGHFIMAHICSVEIEALALGFGPVIKSWTKPGKPEFRLCAIPFGGYCRLKGQQDIERAMARKDSDFSMAEDGSIFAAQSWKRLLIYIAGPLFNILFAILCYTILLTLPVPHNVAAPQIVNASDYQQIFPGTYPRTGLQTGDTIYSVNDIKTETYQELSDTLKSFSDSKTYIQINTDRGTSFIKPVNGKFGILPFTPTIVSNVAPGTPEEESGLLKNDVIIKANGNKVTNMFDLLALDTGKVTFTVLQKGQEKEIHFNHSTRNYGFSLQTPFAYKKDSSFVEALPRAFTHFGKIFVSTLSSVKNLFDGHAKISSTVSGTWQASQSIGFMATEGFEGNNSSGIRITLYLLGCLSISIAIANLLPIPSLDGGLILLSLLEIISHRNFRPKFHLISQIIGWISILLIVTVLFIAGFFHMNI